MIRDFQAQDKGEAMELVREVLGDAVGTTFERRWAWFIENNPFSPPEGPPFLVTEHDGRITGVMMSFAAPAYCDGSTVTMYCLVDLLVHPRRRGIGLPMGKQMIGKPFLMMGSPNRKSLGLWQYLGSQDWGETLTLTRILDPGIFLQRRNLPGAGPLRLAWGLLLRLAAHMTPSGRGVDVEAADSFPAGCDDLWAEVARQGLNPKVPGRGLTFTMVRDRAYLTWRFAQCPVQKYHILLARRQGKLSGYAVLRTGNKAGVRRGYIADLLAPPDDPASAAALIRAAEAWFREREVQAIHCLASSTPSPWTGFLARSGFWFRKRDHHLVATNGIPGHSPEYGRQAIYRHISYADGELDFVS